ncbi:MAG TPA: hypothetical protein VFE62_07500 [Gemmataceae bacterium]|nr:hypothetical protein [Gemmataceae bacterium]
MFEGIRRFFGSLETKLAAEERTAEERYQSLAKALAEGKPPKEAEARDVLQRAGKKINDLQHDVERLLRFRDLRAKVKAAEGVPAMRSQIEAELQDAMAARDMEHQAADARLAEFAAPRELKLSQLDQIDRSASEAMAKLQAMVPQHERRRIASLRREAADLQRQISGFELDNANASAKREKILKDFKAVEERQSPYAHGRWEEESTRRNEVNVAARERDHMLASLDQQQQQRDDLLPKLRRGLATVEAKIAEAEAGLLSTDWPADAETPSAPRGADALWQDQSSATIGR